MSAIYSPLSSPPKNAIVIVAKCPIAGSSKTRLAKTGLLNDDGCATMARAMLCDIITSINNSDELRNCVKFIYHAPSNEEGRRMIQDICTSLNVAFVSSSREEDEDTDTSTNASGIQQPVQSNINDGCLLWNICAMPSGSLQSSDLGNKLAGILEQTRTILHSRYGDAAPSDFAPSVAFVGMDSPELPLSEISYALELASRREQHECKRKAYLNPSHDGGYGMLCVPYHAKTAVFEGVRWSDPLTAVSQIKAMTDCGIDVELGSLMRDIDEAEDLIEFANRLSVLRRGGSKGGSDKVETGVSATADKDDVLSRPPPLRGVAPCQTLQISSYCKHSWMAMKELGIIDDDR